MNYNIAHYFERKRINISDIIYLTRKPPHTVITLMNGESYSTTAMMKWLSSKVCQDLNQTLDKISQDVALRVLAETNGNQSAAAKRLDISRTTLRRLIKQS